MQGTVEKNRATERLRRMLANAWLAAASRQTTVPGPGHCRKQSTFSTVRTRTVTRDSTVPESWIGSIRLDVHLGSTARQTQPGGSRSKPTCARVLPRCHKLFFDALWERQREDPTSIPRTCTRQARTGSNVGAALNSMETGRSWVFLVQVAIRHNKRVHDTDARSHSRNNRNARNKCTWRQRSQHKL